MVGTPATVGQMEMREFGGHAALRILPIVGIQQEPFDSVDAMAPATRRRGPIRSRFGLTHLPLRQALARAWLARAPPNIPVCTLLNSNPRLQSSTNRLQGRSGAQRDRTRSGGKRGRALDGKPWRTVLWPRPLRRAALGRYPGGPITACLNDANWHGSARRRYVSLALSRSLPVRTTNSNRRTTTTAPKAKTRKKTPAKESVKKAAR